MSSWEQFFCTFAWPTGGAEINATDPSPAIDQVGTENRAGTLTPNPHGTRIRLTPTTTAHHHHSLFPTSIALLTPRGSSNWTTNRKRIAETFPCPRKVTRNKNLLNLNMSENAAFPLVYILLYKVPNVLLRSADVNRVLRPFVHTIIMLCCYKLGEV